MRAKCIKMSTVTNNFYIITPKDDIKDKTKEKINQWKDEVKQNPSVIRTDGIVYVHVKTYKELENDVKTSKNPLVSESKIQVSRKTPDKSS